MLYTIAISSFKGTPTMRLVAQCADDGIGIHISFRNLVLEVQVLLGAQGIDTQEVNEVGL